MTHKISEKYAKIETYEVTDAVKHMHTLFIVNKILLTQNWIGQVLHKNDFELVRLKSVMASVKSP